MKGKMKSEGGGRERIRSKYEESDASDDDYKIEDDGEFEDSDEYCSSLAGDELEYDLTDDEREEKVRRGSRLKRRNAFPSKSRSRVRKASIERNVSYKEDSDGDYVDSDYNLKRKGNGVQKAVQKKKSSYMEENHIEEAELNDDNSEDDDDDDYNENEDDKDLPISLPSRKKNEVQKAARKKRSAYTEENNDHHEAENYTSDDDEDYKIDEDGEDLQKVCPSRTQNGVQKSLQKKKALYREEHDDDYEAEDDDEEIGSEDEVDLSKGCLRKKNKDCDSEENNDDGDQENGRSSREHQKALTRTKVSCKEENDEDYIVEDDDCSDGDEYDNDGEEELEEEDDMDFTPNETDFDDEDEFVTVKKGKKVTRTISARGRKRKINSRVSSSKSKKKKPVKRRATKGKSNVRKTRERNTGSKRRRLVVEREQDYTVSEEEREQVREASKFCGRLDVTSLNSSSKKKSEEENLNQGRKNKVRKGKDKVEDSKNAKQVCGICFSEEGKRTIRGTLDCCSHYFCFNCIMEWSKVESRCPLCKQRFTTISKPACDLKTMVVSVPERDQVYQPSEEEIRSYIDPYENVICTECQHGGDDANMLLCDLCDSPAHTYCVGLGEVPEGNWYCEGCRPTVQAPSNPQAPNFTHNLITADDVSARSSPNMRESIDLNRVYEPEIPLAEETGISLSPRPIDSDPRGASLAQSLGVQTVSERRRRLQQIAQIVGRTRAIFQNSSVNRIDTLSLQNTLSQGLLRDNFVLSLQNTFQNSVNRPDTSSFQSTFSQGLLRDNFALSLQNAFQNSVNRPDTSSFQNTLSQGLLRDNFALSLQNTFQNSVIRPDTSSFRSTFPQGWLHDDFALSLQNTFQNSDSRPVPTMPPLSAAPGYYRAPRGWGEFLAGVNNSSVNGNGSLQADLARSFHGHSPMQ